ncbi:radical SAM protein [Candidatus Aminicenantes bacterium AH-873-B07]|nr:radical SAM protein [Candidatus Aminicenantes bacterium AH-873-B07]
MKIREIEARKILTISRISEKMYSLNPYIGCQHACKYCYATFMKRFTGHKEMWGDFIDIKVNSPFLLSKEIRCARKWEIMLSSVTDPYQPLEEKYALTRRCLEILLEYQYPVSILTKSSLILRDINLLTHFEKLEAGLTITTDDENIKKIFEPYSSSIYDRIKTLEILHHHKIKTYAFIGPILPLNPENLAKKLWDIIDFVYIDRMNYCYKIVNLYRKYGLENYLTINYFYKISQELKKLFDLKGIEVRILF